MERARLRTRPRLSLQRHFERSRLEEQLVTTAYELAVPLCRQPLTAPAGLRQDEGPDPLASLTQEGLSA